MKKAIWVSSLAVLMVLGLGVGQGVRAADDAEVMPDVVENPNEIAMDWGFSQDETSTLDTNAAVSGARLVISVDKSYQQMTVMLDGQGLYQWPVSTGRERPEISVSGKSYFSHTPSGAFHIHRMETNHWSVTWAAYMPYAMFFTGGIAIHATTPNHFRELGHRASGGCVRLHPEHARALYGLVQQVGVANTLIIVR